MKGSLSRAIASITLSLVLVVAGAFGVAGVAAMAPSDTGAVDQAIAKTKAKKYTMWRGGKAQLMIYGLTKKQKKKVKYKSSNKKVATIDKKGNIVAKKAGKTTVIAKYKKKTIKYVVTVKEATKLVGNWKLSSGKIDGQYYSETDLKDGQVAGYLTVKTGGKATFKVTGNGNTESASLKWYPTSATRAAFAEGGYISLSGTKLYLNFGDGDYCYFTK